MDFGWTRNASGLAALVFDGDSLRLRALECRLETEQILEWIDEQCGGRPGMVAVDAPLVIPNATGMRPADRFTHTLYGRQHAGCYPANQGRPFAARTIAFSQALSDRGFSHGVSVEPGNPARWQIEVFPHIAAVEFFELHQIIKYKKGPLAKRREGLARLRALIMERLATLDPALLQLRLPEIPAGGKALKAVEDQIDAVLCAYMGAHWWCWGPARNCVLGDAESGYIVIPQFRRR